jgi:hypothetical protein
MTGVVVTCWDCLDGLGEQRAAAAVCAGCGAAVCPDHAVQRAVRLTAIVGLGRQEPVTTPARRIRCRICDAADRDRELTVEGVPVRAGRRR